MRRETSRYLDQGRELLKELQEITVIEREGWAPEMTSRVMARLQAGRPEEEKLEAVVYWASVVNAFTMPGSLVFISRRLLERCRSEEILAFILAHEIAHHDLGHLDLLPEWLPDFARNELGMIAVALGLRATAVVHGPERESDADCHALKLCVRAGYEPEACLEAFRVFESHLLDRRCLDGVFGRDEPLTGDRSNLWNIRNWAWTRKLGYFPIREREERAHECLEKFARENA